LIEKQEFEMNLALKEFETLLNSENLIPVLIDYGKLNLA
jgi:hypothetical protein